MATVVVMATMMVVETTLEIITVMMAMVIVAGAVIPGVETHGAEIHGAAERLTAMRHNTHLNMRLSMPLNTLRNMRHHQRLLRHRLNKNIVIC